jgi:DNA-damage-inducible protein J
MKSANLALRIDPELKKETELVLEGVGLTMTAAFTIFAKAVVRTGAIPFDIMIDPFERKENRDELERRIDGYESGQTKMIETTMEALEAELYG